MEFIRTRLLYSVILFSFNRLYFILFKEEAVGDPPIVVGIPAKSAIRS